ncbi:1-deoxy-D-xylulose-5-phosphate synthase [Desulfosporosinus acididurans]|uniref:1-deoxy-D-xylulose-5-phosphate synthase n=1 Tax=Desulfosporosinus acididurans TaxID=476652 RepID=A0A0J1IK42_9FIRM|nr:transketolase C-terminal domain-containing protein [Desulfosporosinus acididurans]KLU65071.1 1-deoxy-D-xylulose-5-phosphate synthase [Desulfosporosinus acididurans]
MRYDAKNALLWSRLSSRKTFGLVMSELVEMHPNTMVIAADVAGSAGLSDFAQRYPDNFLNVGIAEQNMVGIAAGLAKEGMKVFVVSFAPFASMRCFEVIRTYLGYMDLDVVIVGIASGLSMGVSGNTHYGLEDIALLRTVPNMSVISPADCTETVKVIESLFEHKGPAYLRLTGVEGNPVVYKDNYEFSVGKAIKLREGSEVAIIATGTMVNESLRGAKILQKLGISACVVNMHTIKPLDTVMLDEIFATYKLIVTVEEHSVVGGLGGAIAEYKAARANVPKQIVIGIPDEFGKAAEYTFLQNKYGLTAQGIANRIIAAWNGPL